MNIALSPAMQPQCDLVAAGLPNDGATDAPSLDREPPSIVAALCTCLLGEREAGESIAWPPASVVELSDASGGPATAMTPNPGALERGLRALNELALRESGWHFAQLDRPAQLRSLFQLEGGQGHLSPRRASAFINVFLSLAAQAYLRDARS